MPNPDRMFFRPNKPPTRRQIASKVVPGVATPAEQQTIADKLTSTAATVDSLTASLTPTV